ncbi:MAG TPA: choice-of-anchor tandem repeat GloVer-containing protein [Bryobacteraceae bacterium]|nr:choice-of-anchor tandem repeat GloVer-containing protein [Bryobacteraceae bacterium]
MLKILQTDSIGGRLGDLLPLLALVIVLPCSAANPPSLVMLYSFNDLADGGFPEAGLAMSSAGALYGTTSSSQGGYGWGSVFEMVPIKGGTFTHKTLYTFKGGVDGANPVADLTIGGNGILYGTTYGGGVGYGTVFELIPGSGGTWTQKVIYSFKGGSSDGAYPAAGLVLASSGVLYGTTYAGGTKNIGTVFALAPSAGGWTETPVYSFLGGTDGANPVADLTLSVAPGTITLYGTTLQGGSVTIPPNTPPLCTSTTSPCVYQNWGTVFQLVQSGGVWTETILYTFLGASDGGSPESPVIIGPGGVLYGATFWGGSTNGCPLGGYPQGCGVVYQLTPPTGTGAWTQTVLHTFTGTVPDGNHPYGRMSLNSTTGQLFGTTFSGGALIDNCFTESYPGCGTIFSMKPPATQGGSWTKSNLIVFLNNNGGGPNGGVLSKGGAIFGTTLYGGNTGGYGTVYEMKP